MKSVFKRMFEQKCPECNELLSSVNDKLSYMKVCPHGHYKEETYCSLGVTIVYEDLK